MRRVILPVVLMQAMPMLLRVWQGYPRILGERTTIRLLVHGLRRRVSLRITKG